MITAIDRPNLKSICWTGGSRLFRADPNDPARSNRAGGVPLSDNIVRGGINDKINWLIANFLDQVRPRSRRRMPRSNFTRSTSELLNATLHSSFLLDRAAPSLFRHRLYRIFDFCGAGSPGFAKANAGPVSVGELDAQACRSCFGPVGAIDRTHILFQATGGPAWRIMRRPISGIAHARPKSLRLPAG